jgi:hypothetical protein
MCTNEELSDIRVQHLSYADESVSRLSLDDAIFSSWLDVKTRHLLCVLQAVTSRRSFDRRRVTWRYNYHV